MIVLAPPVVFPLAQGLFGLPFPKGCQRVVLDACLKNVKVERFQIFVKIQIPFFPSYQYEKAILLVGHSDITPALH